MDKRARYEGGLGSIPEGSESFHGDMCEVICKARKVHNLW